MRFEVILKSLLQLSVFWKTHLCCTILPQTQYLPACMVNCQDFCAQGECNVALLDTTEEKNIFAAVNRPTYFLKKYFFCFEKNKLL